jgi:hypothetical protein
MISGYKVRSAVAHGGDLSAEDIKVKGEQVSLAEFVQATEEIVRAGLLKAIQGLQETQGQLSIPWDELVRQSD